MNYKIWNEVFFVFPKKEKKFHTGVLSVCSMSLMQNKTYIADFKGNITIGESSQSQFYITNLLISCGSPWFAYKSENCSF